MACWHSGTSGLGGAEPKLRVPLSWHLALGAVEWLQMGLHSRFQVRKPGKKPQYRFTPS